MSLSSKDKEVLTKNQTASADPLDTESVSSSSLLVAKSFGVRKSEIIVEQVNTVKRKIIFFFSVFLCFYIINVEGDVLSVFVGYATNDYKEHSLMSTVSVISGVVASGSLPFYARLADTYGRLELLSVSLIFRVVGILILSRATNVQKYAGGAALMSFGHSGTMILLQVSLSDASSLRWRLLAIGLTYTQSIINTWSTGEIVTALLGNTSWQFGVAMWAFITPLFFAPFFIHYTYLTLQAAKTDKWKQVNHDQRRMFIEGLPSAGRFFDSNLERVPNTGLFMERIKNKAEYVGLALIHNVKLVFWYVDCIGCVLIACVLGLLLVPLTLAGGTSSKWKQAKIIVPLVLGVLLIPVFVVWETKITKRPMVPFKVMKNRGIWAALVVSILDNFVYALVNGYAYPVLLVGMNASTTVATRTPLLNTFVTAITLSILGFVVGRVRRTKAFILFGCAMLFLSMGLFVHFRGSNDGLRGKYYRDGIAVAMCVLGFSQAFLNRLVFVSAQSCTNHEYMATVMAIFAAFYRVGHTLGGAVSGAIWTQEMYQKIRSKMVEFGVDDSLAEEAYGSPYTYIETYKWGTNQRRAVSIAYAEIQRALSITGLSLCVLVLFFCMFLRDHRLTDSQNLDDENVKDEELEKGKTAADRVKSEVAFTNDKDYILDFLKRLAGRKVKE